jgi:predicted MFS family arabinose efflux permease
MVLIYTHLGTTSFATVVIINVILFVGIFSRIIPFQALVTSVPEPTQRGSFNAVSASTQQLSGALASLIAGHIVTFGADGKLQHFPIVGYVVIGSTLISGVAVWQIQRDLRKRASQPGQTNADP